MGALQDKNECLGDNALEDEMSVSIESGGNEILVMDNENFFPSTVKDINRNFMCIDIATVYVKEHDLLGDDRASSRITCSVMDYYFEFDVPSRDCFLTNNPVKYRIYFSIKDIEKDAFV